MIVIFNGVLLIEIDMPFHCDVPHISFSKPLFSIILGNTILSTVPGISGAGSAPAKTVLTPILDSEFVVNGSITSRPVKPNTPTGCPTPATITRAMVELTGIIPLFINAGLVHPPTVPCLDVYGTPGEDPRFHDAVPFARELFGKGVWIGSFLSSYGDFLLLGECVPGGTTTALCVLRGLGYDASVSSSYINNPIALKNQVCETVLSTIARKGAKDPLDIVKYAGDPMLPLAAGIAHSFTGSCILAGGTQMLAVAAILRKMGLDVPGIATTTYVRDDPSASFERTAEGIGVPVYYIDPDFGVIADSGLKRYCIGEVKEGMGAGGAMILAAMLGYSEETIKKKIFEVVSTFS